MDIEKKLEEINEKYKNINYNLKSDLVIESLRTVIKLYNNFYKVSESKVDKKKEKDLYFKVKNVKKKIKKIEEEIKNLQLRKQNSFDVVVLVGPNDLDIVDKQIEYTKKNVIGYRNIYLVSCDRNLKIDQTITIDENVFPFKLDKIKDFIVKNNKRRTINRKKWYFQQL